MRPLCDFPRMREGQRLPEYVLAGLKYVCKIRWSNLYLSRMIFWPIPLSSALDPLPLVSQYGAFGTAIGEHPRLLFTAQKPNSNRLQHDKYNYSQGSRS